MFAVGGGDLRERLTEHVKVVGGGVSGRRYPGRSFMASSSPVLSQVTRIKWNPNVCL